nr:alpha-amylase family glycosyl hydrolase [Treponemataceae bacterium]
LANENPALETFSPLFSDESLKKDPAYQSFWNIFRSWSAEHPPFGPENRDLVSMLKAPVDYSPFDLKGQLEYVRTRWADILGEWLARLLSGLDLIAEEEKPGWGPGPGADGYEMPIYEFDDISKEYERFSPDRDWMPNVVMIAKSTLVWLDQLSRKYNRPITRLDQIPDEELDFLEQAGFTGLWLIGLWERSPASARIKQICGNPEAAASAYSLNDYEIAEELGGWAALANLRSRAWSRGIRMASDMVPNHTGMDSSWVVNKPDLFIQTRESPFPGYDFSGENLSHDDRVGIYLENHYYSKTDCAVVFKRVDHHTGDTRYIYHGNDGTGMPWNDTAQIDFLNPEAREAVIQKILHVASNFPIIRFDAAMVLAKKHIQRLWYPEPGKGGDIASRSRFALSRDDFERRIPEEFWREVVDRCAKEIPDTLLLAEAFWMMEGYFVRTLGMHRVYNSAFMNMLKREENDKYRSTIKNTIEFDPEILKRYVNFMNNPDEETAVAQFGRDDKYFGVCTMMAAMPGLPMFGHGQVEGFEEKYGMEYRKAYRDETPDEDLLNRHRHEIFPLMKKRYLFAGVEHFCLYDFYENGRINENVFAWSNRCGDERALILFNNVYGQTSGWVRVSVPSAVKNPDGSKTLVQKTLAEGLGLQVKRDRFCIMQEQRSGLWYLRTTEEIASAGLYASLQGFQTQVFVNMHEIDDNEWGHYRALYDSLGGKGVRDIQMGIKNIFLKDLYDALQRVFSTENIDSIKNLFSTAKSEGIPKELKEVLAETWKKPAQNFYRVAADFLKTRAETAPIVEGNKIADSIEITKTAGKFLDSIEALATIHAEISENKNEAFPPKRIFDGGIRALDLAAAALCAGLRHLTIPPGNGTALADIVDLWSLDRKIADIFTDAGIGDGKTEEVLGIMKKTALIFNERKTGKKMGCKDYAALVFAHPEAGALAGVHEWDGIQWFNKERAESIIDLIASLALIGTIRDQDSKPLKTAEVKKNYASAQDMISESGYKTSFFPLPEIKAEKTKKPAGKSEKTAEKAAPKTAKTDKKSATTVDNKKASKTEPASKSVGAETKKPKK